MAQYSRKDLGSGIAYTNIIDPKFKTQRIQICFLTKLDAESASENAMAVGIMGSSNQKFKNISEITAKLNSLYGANISVIISRTGDIQKLCIGTANICNKYALEGEDITSEVTSILLDCLFSPNASDGSFADEPFEFRKKDLLDTIQAEINNKRGYAIMQAAKSTYVNEPCAVSPYGSKETAMKVTPQSAYSAYRNLLKNAQVEIYYVGPEESGSTEKMLSEAFLSINRTPDIVSFYTPSPLKNEVCRTDEKLDVNQCKMVMAFKSQSEDFDAAKLLNTIFGATPFSKLFANVREKQSLCYYCASRYTRYKKTMIVDCGIEEENIAKTEAEILAQLEEIKNGNFSGEDIQNSLLYIQNALKGIGDTPYSYIDWYFGGFASGNITDPQSEAARLASVTKERIIEAAKSFSLDTVYIMRGE